MENRQVVTAVCCHSPVGSGWEHDPERYFGIITVKVDPGEEEEGQHSRSMKGIKYVDDGEEDEGDDDNDGDNISGVSGSYEDNDEVPFGPPRAAAGEGKDLPTKSLEELSRGGGHPSHAGKDIEEGVLKILSQRTFNCSI